MQVLEEMLDETGGVFPILVQMAQEAACGPERFEVPEGVLSVLNWQAFH